MAASSRFATVSEDDFALKCSFFLFFLNNHLRIYTKTIIRKWLSVNIHRDKVKVNIHR